MPDPQLSENGHFSPLRRAYASANVMASFDRLRVDVLGPIRVSDHQGRDLTPDGLLQRRLLALLVLRRGRVVSADTAVDVLWPVRPPRDAAAALQNHLYRLRRALPDGVIESTGTGYRLVAPVIEVDADRLADVLNGGNDDPATTATIEQILGRWHGPAYPELDDVDEGRVEALRLEELRIRATEELAARRLSAGDTDGLAAELAALAEEFPLRERPRALLMTALAASGRNAEALRVYDDFRRRLGDELGIEPSPALAAQHAELLRGSPHTTWKPPTRLPVPVTSLVGRRDLVVELAATVEANRLVSFVGPGGVGKTRLLVEVGRRLHELRPDRPVVMCELATASAESAVDAVAAALAIEGRPTARLADRVAAFIGDLDLILLLDNCEHVLDPVADLAECLLAACPAVHVVTTTRERLRVAGEHVCSVPTLPSSGAGAAAVQLFVERARAVAQGFEPTDAQLDTIRAIVRRLDGLPLAIELAAARLHTLDLTEVATGLDDRFALLSSGYRTLSRHRSLGAAISWSYGLLEPRLQRAFADLSVFTSPFTVDDAAAICDLSVAAATVALDQLVERSLVMRAPRRRYVLLETLRAFGAEQLATEGRLEAVHDRHADYHVDWLEATDRRLIEPGGATLADIDDALSELRSSHAWLLHRGRVEHAGRLVAAVYTYAMLRLRPDVLAWAERVTDASPDDRSPLAAVVWAVSSSAAWMAGNLGDTAVRSDRALRVAESAGGAVPAAVARTCGNTALFEGRLEDAVAWYRRALDAAAGDRAQWLMAAGTQLLARAYAGDPGVVDAAAELLADVGDVRTPHTAYAWYCAGEAILSVDVAGAKQRLERSLEIAEATRASFVAGIAGASKTSIEARLGDPLTAAEEYRHLLAYWRRAGMWSTQWTMLRSVAGLLARLGRHRDAAVLLGAVQATAEGHRIFGADAAALAELGATLRCELGEEAFGAARAEGATLDGDTAVDHALRALSS